MKAMVRVLLEPKGNYSPFAKWKHQLVVMIFEYQDDVSLINFIDDYRH